MIILLSKSDDQSVEKIELLKRSLADHLRKSGIGQFRFPKETFRQPPFTVCSVPSDDDDNMDASLLMSSEYVQPLIPSELGVLLEQLFDKDTISCIRHLAATKIVQAQKQSDGSRQTWALARGTLNPTTLLSQTIPTSPSSSPICQPTSPGLSPFIQATISDHTMYEERLAQVRLAKWASDLRRSLQNERQRYEALVQEEQAAWLSEKLDELERKNGKDGINLTKKLPKNRRYRSGTSQRYQMMKEEDPLGLIRHYETLTQNGWIALQVAGGFGVLGAVAVWVARSWSSGSWEINWWKGA